MNATNLTKQIVLFSFGPNVSQDLGYNTEANTTSGLLASAFFVIGTADYKYYQKKKSYSPYVTCIATPPSSKPPALFEQQCRIFWNFLFELASKDINDGDETEGS